MGQDEKPLILTPELCRAARGLLDWTQADLAGHADISRSTVRDYEGSRHDVHRATAAQLRRAFEDRGVVFVDIAEVGPGLCLKNLPRKTPDSAG
jgi:transcriptional regulator with XRE-family HTH domain